MINSLFVLAQSGKSVLVEKHWGRRLSRSLLDTFWLNVSSHSSSSQVSPMILLPEENLVMCNIFRENLIFLVVSEDSFPTSAFSLLNSLISIFESYLGDLNEFSFRDNFSIIYLILEEAITAGYPSLMEADSLKTLIFPPNLKTKLNNLITSKSIVSHNLPKAAISTLNWRSRGLKYSTNEVFVDVIEKISGVFNSRGKIVKSRLDGNIEVSSNLSGMPELLMILRNLDVLEDYSFHKCVRMSRFESERILSFVPPDEDFVLFRYNVDVDDDDLFSSNIPLYCKPQISYFYSDESFDSNASLNVMIGPKGTFTGTSSHHQQNSTFNRFEDKFNASKRSSSASGIIKSISGKLATAPGTIKDVKLQMQLQPSALMPDLKASVGKVEFDEARKILSWKIGDIDPNSSALNPKLCGKIKYDFKAGERKELLNCTLHFAVERNLISQVALETLQVLNVEYSPFKGIKTKVASGEIVYRF